MKLAITIGSAKVYLSNLFGGDPILGKQENPILLFTLLFFQYIINKKVNKRNEKDTHTHTHIYIYKFKIEFDGC